MLGCRRSGAGDGGRSSSGGGGNGGGDSGGCGSSRSSTGLEKDGEANSGRWADWCMGEDEPSDWQRDVSRRDAQGPTYSWRGHPPVGHVPARFYGKGMRIDHFLVSTMLFDRVRRCDILGHGRDRVGFMGSDHCPVVLELAPTAAAATGGTAASEEQS